MASRGKGGAVGAAARLATRLGHLSAPIFEQQLCRDLWEVQGPGHPLWGRAVSKGRLCPGAGLAVSTASSSAELTSKVTSNPLLFPGSSPISQLSASELAAQRTADEVPGDEEHAVPPQGFSQALLLTFDQRGCLQGLCPCSHPWECFCLLVSRLSLPVSQDPALAGRSWHLALSLLPSVAIPAGCSEAHFPS